MYRKVMAIFLQYDVHLILLVELPARDLLCTCVMRAFKELTKLYVQQRQLLKMFQFNLKCCSKYCDTYCTPSIMISIETRAECIVTPLVICNACTFSPTFGHSVTVSHQKIV